MKMAQRFSAGFISSTRLSPTGRKKRDEIDYRHLLSSFVPFGTFDHVDY
jgi:hypothetical protein